MPLVVRVKQRRWVVVTAAPLEHLILSILQSGLFFVPALQLTIVALVEPPVLVGRDPIAVKLICDMVESLHRSLEVRSVGDVEKPVLSLKATAGRPCLLDSLLR